MSTITLEQALIMTQGALQYAQEVSAAPLTIAVLDNAGRLVSLQRQDGSALLRPDIAIGKAWGAIALGRSSRGLAQVAEARPGFMSAVNVMADGNLGATNNVSSDVSIDPIVTMILSLRNFVDPQRARFLDKVLKMYKEGKITY